jgi:hypothetical protein
VSFIVFPSDGYHTSDGLKTKERFFTAFRMTKRMPDRTPVEKNSRDSISAYGSKQSG